MDMIKAGADGVGLEGREGAGIPEGGLEPRTEREGFILAMRQHYD